MIARFDDVPEPTRDPTEPTRYPAGSFGRIEAYRQRFERGEHLWHPLDARTIVPPSDGRAIQRSTPAILARIGWTIDIEGEDAV